MELRLVVDADVVDEVTGAIGPLISNSSRAPRFADVGVVDGTGLDRCFDDDDDATAAGVVDTRADLVDCGVEVGAGAGAGADFLDGVGRALVC